MRQLFEPLAASLASGLSHGNPRQYAAIAATFLRWVLLGTISGLLAGPASAIFLVTLRWASRVHSENPWLLALLPLAGVAIYLLYSRVGGVAERGNNLLVEEVHLNRQDVPLRMAPLSFLAPVITLLFGGSIASVGTAVQMGGTLADWLARTLHLSKEERRVMLMAGLSGGFGSVIGTPLAGAIFGMEVQSVGRIRYEGIVPCLTSSIVGYAIVRTLGAYGSTYPLLPAMEVDVLLLLKVTLAGVAFGLCGLLFIEFTHATSAILNRIVRRQFWLKPVLGGCAIIVLAVLPGAQAYLGLSQPLLAAVWGGASIATFAFLWKLIFTGLTVGSGFKGGEITPLFIMGAALGYVLAQPLGAPLQLLAAIGFAAVFAGASNTPLACAIMAVELFGSGGFIYMLVGTVTSYIFSGHRSIYTTQRVDTPKFIFEVPRRFAVRDIMTRAPATVTPDTPLPEVLSLLKQRQVKSVIVLNGVDGTGGHVQGIVTAGDLFRRGGLSLEWAHPPAGSGADDNAPQQPAGGSMGSPSTPGAGAREGRAGCDDAQPGQRARQRLVQRGVAADDAPTPQATAGHQQRQGAGGHHQPLGYPALCRERGAHADRHAAVDGDRSPSGHVTRARLDAHERRQRET